MNAGKLITFIFNKKRNASYIQCIKEIYLTPFNNFSTAIFPIRKITRLIHKIYNKQRSRLHTFIGIIATMLHPKDTRLKVSHDTSPTNSIREHRVSFLLMLHDFLSLFFLFSPLRAIDNCSFSVRFFLDSCPRESHLTEQCVSKED